MPLDGLGDSFKTGAAVALREVADTSKVGITGGANHPRPGRLAVQGLQLRTSRTRLGSSAGADHIDTKLVNVTLSGSGDNITYFFGLYTPQVRSNGSFNTGLGQLISRPFEHEIFSLENNDAFTSVKSIPSIASQLGESWDYSILKTSVSSVKNGAKDSTLYAELWTDYASAGENDYMVGGWWLLAPNNPSGDYRFGALSKAENYYPRSDGPVKAEVTDTATYKGPAAGLHTSSENGMVSIQRLLGKVTLTADFGNDTAMGIIKGEINNLTLGGDSVDGQLLLPEATFDDVLWSIRPIAVANDGLNPKSNVGNIKGINYRGDWAGTFQGDSSGTAQPTGIVGVVGGSGGGNSFVASFGAKKVMDEE